jgi:hypothetical protein
MKDPHGLQILTSEQIFTLEELCAKNCLTWAVAGPDCLCTPRYCKKLSRFAIDAGLNPVFFGLADLK